MRVRYTKDSLWPSTQFQPSHFLSSTEDESLVCYAAEERVFIYDNIEAIPPFDGIDCKLGCRTWRAPLPLTGSG